MTYYPLWDPRPPLIAPSRTGGAVIDGCHLHPNLEAVDHSLPDSCVQNRNGAGDGAAGLSQVLLMHPAHHVVQLRLLWNWWHVVCTGVCSA